MRETAKRALVAVVVGGGIVVLALALWRLRLLIALLFLGFIIAAAMRPGIEALARRGVPRAGGILLHYVGLAAAVGLMLWAVVPRVIDQVDEAIGELPQQTEEATGIKHEILNSIQQRLDTLPSGEQIFDPAVEITLTAFEVAVGIFFMLATAAYWIYERDRAVAVVSCAVPPVRRRLVRETWQLIDLKLGSYVRGQGVLIFLVGMTLSLAFFAIGVPYWLLVGSFAGLVEIVPVIGPLVAGALAIGVGFTESWHIALAAGISVLVVRLAEDYLIIPRVLGHAVGLTPLTVLVAVTASALLFGGFAVILAIPLAAVGATLLDVILRERNPAEEDVPKVLFPAKEGETTGVGRG
jgi:predicted PurR-regulated permease PerM